MKKLKLLLLIAGTLSIWQLKAQAPPPSNLTPNSVLDTVYDRFGTKKLLKDIMFVKTGSVSVLPIPGPSGPSGPTGVSALNQTCGYFQVYFALNSGMEIPADPAHIRRRNVICQLLTDMSAFLYSPLTGTNTVNILIDDMTMSSSAGAAGVASGYYAHATNPQFTQPGIADNEMWKTIHAGVDSYTGVAPPVNLSVNSFFHGWMAFDFTGAINWNELMNVTASPSQMDLYTVALHELTHALGFASLINNTGISKFGSLSNYYSRYDLFLKDNLGQSLLTNTGACSPVYGQTFNPLVPLSALSPIPASCPNDIVFAGSVNQKCYTPSSFAPGSSLSHFEDICHAPTPYPIGTYYVMNSGTPFGVSKRFLKQEERMALCDLGYKTNTTYGTPADFTYTTYVGTCKGIEVAGICDGVAAGGFLYTTTLPTLSIPIAAVVANDYAVALPITPTCVESVYANGTVAIVGSNIVFTASFGYTGPVLLRYVPQDVNGVSGNITYIYGFILPTGCSPVSPCDMVQNGGFENVSGSNCGYLGAGVNANCWYGNTGTVDVFERGCFSAGGGFNLGTNTYATVPPWNNPPPLGPPNDHIIGLYSGFAGGGHYNESLENFLGAPLTNGTVYNLTYKVFNYSGSFPTSVFVPTINIVPTPCVLTIQSSSVIAIALTPYPNTMLNTILSTTLTAPVNTWVTNSISFTYTGPTGHNVLFFGMDKLANIAAGYSDPLGKKNFYVLLDDISLIPASLSPTLTIPTATCVGSSILDLGLYAQPPGGSFSGPGITSTGGIYNFNSPAVLGSGLYTIGYTFTNTAINCAYTTYATINVLGGPPTLTVIATPSVVCLGNSTWLTATGATTYTWDAGTVGPGYIFNPTITDTYTVQGENACGISTETVQVIVITTPTITVSASPAVICAGQSSTLTASGALTYTWMPGGLVGSSVVVSPFGFTSYTVTGTNSCGVTSTEFINITVISPPLKLTATASQTLICAGSSVVLTASGGGIPPFYVWSAPISASGATVAVAPIVTTTYVVTTTVPVCGTYSAAVTVSVIAIPASSWTLSLITTTAIPCVGSPITLVANVTPVGTYTYNWSAPISLNTATVTFNPTDNYNYNCNVTDLCGNVKSISTCLSVVSSKCCLPSEASLNNLNLNGSNAYSSLGGGSFEILNTITISGNVVWSNCDFKMGIGAKIVILPGAKLTINNSHLYSCVDMWEGIVLQSFGTGTQPRIEMNNSTIEDAYRAIFLDLVNDPYIDNIVTNGTQFNKNYIGISIANSSTFSSALPPSVTINNTGAFTSSVTATSPGSKLKCSNFYVPSLRARGYVGVKFTDFTSGLVIGTPTPPLKTLYENLDYGYHGTSSRVRMYNSHFNNLSGISLYSTSTAVTHLGVGVFATNPAMNPSARVNVFDCNFTNVWKGVYLTDANDFEVSTSTFSNSTVSSGLCLSGCIASSFIETTNHKTTGSIKNNTFKNVQTAIAHYYSTPSSPTYSLGIGQNNIIATPAGYVGLAISIQAAINTYSLATAGIAVANNTITNVRNGIFANNIKSGLRVSTNKIAFQFVASGARYGIKYTGNQNAYTDNNTINSFGTSNVNLTGIFMQLSPGCKTQCNTISTVGRCVVFDGNNASNVTGFIRNTMNTSNTGLYLSNNGIIGDQGQGGPLLFRRNSENTWNGVFTYKTYTSFSTAQNSKLFIRNNAVENPFWGTNMAGNSGSAVSPATKFWTSPSSPLPTLLPQSAIFPLTCPNVLLTAAKVAPWQPLNDVAEAISLDADLLSLVTNTVSLNAAAAYLQQQFVYGLLKRPQIATSNLGLLNFASTNSVTSLADYTAVDTLIKNGQYSTAQIVNNTAVTVSTMEQNHNDINTQLINKLLNSNYAYTTGQVLLIETIANKCPLNDGNAVYQARTLLQIIKEQFIEFTDSCDVEKPSGARVANVESAEIITNVVHSDFVLYPNPNNGEFNVLYNIDAQLTNVTINIIDINGRLVYEHKLDTESNMSNFNTNNLKNGVYHFTIIDANNNQLYNTKLVIIK